MNSNTAGGLLVAILAACGFAWGVPVTVWACIAVCISAFLAEELRAAPEAIDGLEGFDLDAVAGVLAAISWIGVAFAIVALVI